MVKREPDPSMQQDRGSLRSIRRMSKPEVTSLRAFNDNAFIPPAATILPSIYLPDPESLGRGISLLLLPVLSSVGC